MPILAKEIELHPAGLLETEPAPNGCRWCVAHVKPRQEKSMARHLLSSDIGYYLPSIRRTKVYQGQRVCSYVPAFTSYVFVHADGDERAEALGGNQIVGIIDVFDQQRLHGELARVWQLTASDLTLYPESRLEAGTPVRIVSGPLMGLEGVVVSRKGRCRFVVAVNFIQQGVAAEIDANVLEPL